MKKTVVDMWILLEMFFLKLFMIANSKLQTIDTGFNRGFILIIICNKCSATPKIVWYYHADTIHTFNRRKTKFCRHVCLLFDSS